MLAIRTYRLSKYKLTPSPSKTVYPGQGVFDIHLMPYSSIVELATEANRLKKTVVTLCLSRFYNFVYEKMILRLFSCKYDLFTLLQMCQKTRFK